MTPEKIREACKRAGVPPEVQSSFGAHLPAVLGAMQEMEAEAAAQASAKEGKGK